MTELGDQKLENDEFLNKIKACSDKMVSLLPDLSDESLNVQLNSILSNLLYLCLYSQDPDKMVEESFALVKSNISKIKELKLTQYSENKDVANLKLD